MEEQTKILNYQVNLPVLGFRRVADKFRYVPKICMLTFAGLFFLVILYAFFKSKLYIPRFEVYCLVLMFVSLAVGFSSVNIPRSCPECKRGMHKLFPDNEDAIYSYKYYCGYCKVYIDTEVYNSDGD